MLHPEWMSLDVRGGWSPVQPQSGRLRFHTLRLPVAFTRRKSVWLSLETRRLDKLSRSVMHVMSE